MKRLDVYGARSHLPTRAAEALVLVLVLGLSACAKWAPPAPSRRIAFAEPVTLVVGTNGMRVVVVPGPATDSVTLDVRYKVGSAADPPGKEGLAHLVEHLMFALHPWGHQRPSVDAELAEVALYSNAYTTWDYTHYQSLAPAGALPRLLAIEAARMRFDCAHLSQESFEREREVVRNELRSRHGRASFGIRLHQAIYGESHPYHRSPGGNESTLATITRADVCAFVYQYYRPDTAIITFTGGVTMATVVPVLEEHLGAISARPGPPLPLTRPWTPAREHRVLEADIDKSLVLLVIPMPPRHAASKSAADLALAMLAAQADEDKPDYIDDVGYAVMGGELAPVGILVAEVESTGALDKARDYLRKQLAAMRTDELAHERALLGPMGIEMLANAHNTRLLFHLESMMDRGDIYADYAHFDASGEFATGELRRMHTLGAGAVRQAKATLLEKEPMVLYIRKSPGLAEKYARSEIGAFAGTHRESTRRVPIDAAEAERPLSISPPRSRLRDARVVMLDNGMKVIMLPSSAYPLVDVRLVLRAGNIVDPDNQGGLADMAEALVGTGGYKFRADSASTWSLVMMGIRRDSHVGSHTTTISLSGQARFVDAMIHNLEKEVRGKFSAKSLGKVREELIKSLGKSEARRSIRQSRAVLEAIYGADHPYSRLAEITAESIGNIDISALTRFQNEHYRAANATLIIAGNFDPVLVEKHVRWSFERWGGGQRPERTVESSRRQPAPAYLAIDRADRVQTKLSIFFPTAPRIDGEHAARLVLAEMLALRMAAVRERMAASYGIDVSYSPEVGPGLFVITGEVDTKRAGEALTFMREAIDSLRRGEDLAQDFALARRRVARNALVEDFDTMALSARLAFLSLHGLELDYYEHLAHAVAALRPEAVARIIAKELAPEQETILCIGAWAEIERAFQQAGIAKPTLIR